MEIPADFEGMHLAKKGLPFFLNLALILLFIPGFSQINLDPLGIKQHGNTLENPFFSGEYFRQDSLGRLQFEVNARTLRFDGKNFSLAKESNRGSLRFVDALRKIKWYQTGPFEVAAYRADTLFKRIHTKEYFRLNFNTFYQKEHNFYLVTNSGAIHFTWKDEDLEYQRSIPVKGQDIYDMIHIGDTLYFHTKAGTRYILESAPQTEHIYIAPIAPKKNFFLIPGQRMVQSRFQHLGVFNEKNRILDASTKLYQVLIKQKENVLIYLQDSKGRIWIGKRLSHTKGLYVLEPGSQEMKYVDLGLEEKPHILEIFEDKEGNIWLGTSEHGIIQLYEKSIQVLNKGFGLSSNNIWCIEQSNTGSIYFSAGCKGIDILYPDGNLGHIHENGCQVSTLSDSLGNLWVNTRGVSLFQEDIFIKNYQKEAGLYSRSPICLFEDSKHTIWVGTRKAIHKYDKGKFIAYVQEDLADFNRLFNIVEYEKGKLLLAFSDGDLFTFIQEKFTRVPFPSKKISHLYKDREGRTWIATHGDGLFRYQGGEIEAIDQSTQIPKSITYLQEDLQGYLWGLCADNTIFYTRKDPLWRNQKELVMKTLTTENGLPLINTNTKQQPAAELLQDGRIIFPNIHGAILLDPQKIRKEKSPFNHLIHFQDSLYKAGSVWTLAYGENDLEFSISAVSLHPENSFEYEFKVNESSWRKIEDPTSITLNNLGSGRNKIVIRSKHRHASWQESEIQVEVPTLIYFRWWFLLLMLALLAGCIILLVKWRTRLVKHQNEILEQKVSIQTEEIEKEKKQLAEALKKQQELTHELNLSQASKNRMYAQISHEFNSPLQAIHAYFKPNTEEIGFEDKHRISGNIKQLLQISQEIMALSRAESGKLKAKKDYYNIISVIQEQIELKQILADEKGIGIHFTHPDQRQYVYCDLSLMQKVMGNLLSNAIKFSQRDATIKVRVEDTDQTHSISIVDTGIGIPADEIQDLTLAYFQASNNPEAGTGIGLSLVDLILKLHESQLMIQSELGKGSIFSFQIKKTPLSIQEIEQNFTDNKNIQAQLAKHKHPEKARILSIDDNVDILHFIRNTLSVEYNVITSVDALSVLSLIDEIKPDLIISDVNMPMMSGTEFLKEIRKTPRFSGIPFLLLTGSISDDIEISGLNSGADFVLQKPIEEEYLKSQIKQMLTRQNRVIDQAKTSFAHDLLPPHLSDDDLALVQEIEKYILSQIDNAKLKSEDIAEAIGIGEKTLRNRVKKITGFTVKTYLKHFRLEKSRILLEQGYGTKGEIAGAVGFSSLSYFSKSYKQYFGEESKN